LIFKLLEVFPYGVELLLFTIALPGVQVFATFRADTFAVFPAQFLEWNIKMSIVIKLR